MRLFWLATGTLTLAKYVANSYVIDLWWSTYLIGIFSCFLVALSVSWNYGGQDWTFIQQITKAYVKVSWYYILGVNAILAFLLGMGKHPLSLTTVNTLMAFIYGIPIFIAHFELQQNVVNESSESMKEVLDSHSFSVLLWIAVLYALLILPALVCAIDALINLFPLYS